MYSSPHTHMKIIFLIYLKEMVAVVEMLAESLMMLAASLQTAVLTETGVLILQLSSVDHMLFKKYPRLNILPLPKITQVQHISSI